MPKNKGLTEVSISPDYPDWCNGCGICVAFCPGQVLELGQEFSPRFLAPRFLKALQLGLTQAKKKYPEAQEQWTFS